jgi:hypothetical protein
MASTFVLGRASPCDGPSPRTPRSPRSLQPWWKTILSILKIEPIVMSGE